MDAIRLKKMAVLVKGSIAGFLIIKMQMIMQRQQNCQ